MKRQETVNILMAEDDHDDRLLIQEALNQNNFATNIHFVEDGEALMDYLHKRGAFVSKETFRPGLILLDLNMPRVDGRQALKMLKSDPSFRRIPVIVLTTSKSEKDIQDTYNLGVNSFISKPGRFTELVQVTREIGQYWLETVALPKE
jgi:two-component system response regulator